MALDTPGADLEHVGRGESANGAVVESEQCGLRGGCGVGGDDGGQAGSVDGDHDEPFRSSVFFEEIDDGLRAVAVKVGGAEQDESFAIAVENLLLDYGSGRAVATLQRPCEVVQCEDGAPVDGVVGGKNPEARGRREVGVAARTAMRNSS